MDIGYLLEESELKPVYEYFVQTNSFDRMIELAFPSKKEEKIAELEEYYYDTIYQASDIIASFAVNPVSLIAHHSLS